MGARRESGILGGRKKFNVKQIVKKIDEKFSKIGEIGKDRKNQIFFFTENGLKCIRNPTTHL